MADTTKKLQTMSKNSTPIRPIPIKRFTEGIRGKVLKAIVINGKADCKNLIEIHFQDNTAFQMRLDSELVLDGAQLVARDKGESKVVKQLA
jgi:hypothetical protein